MGKGSEAVAGAVGGCQQPPVAALAPGALVGQVLVAGQEAGPRLARVIARFVRDLPPA